MKKNVGSVDRIIRVVAGLVLLCFAVIGGAKWGYLGIVPLFTGLIGWCPPYSILGISTCKKCTGNDSASGYACRTRS